MAADHYRHGYRQFRASVAGSALASWGYCGGLYQHGYRVVWNFHVLVVLSHQENAGVGCGRDALGVARHFKGREHRNKWQLANSDSIPG